MSAEIAEIARAWVGTPYRHMAAVRGVGCDCLGLVRGVWAQWTRAETYPIAPYSADWRFGGAELEAGLAALLARHDGPPMAGDVALFRLHRGLPPRHCAIVIGPDRFVHAQERIGVVEAALTQGWARRLAGLYAFSGK